MQAVRMAEIMSVSLVCGNDDPLVEG
jgi:hypothetical protein